MRGKRIEDKLDGVAKSVERLDAAMVVRDPTSKYATEVFDGLRKSITFASQQQRTHISTLLGLLDDLSAGASVDTMELRLRDRLTEAGVQELTDSVAFPAAFREVDETTPERSAWVLVQNDGTSIVMRDGLAHARPPAQDPTREEDSPAQEPERAQEAKDAPEESPTPDLGDADTEKEQA